MPMWPSPLMLAIVILSFLCSWYLLQGSGSERCLILLTGESIRISGCDLSPDHLRALSQLKVLQVDL
jgi:hypothetical protein